MIMVMILKYKHGEKLSKKKIVLYDVLPKVIPKNVFHDDNWMILKYKHGETWDCIGWWFLHWYLIWNIKNGYTELDNFDVYLLTRNQICTHCVRNYSEACTDVIWAVVLASEQMIDYWDIKTDDWLLRRQNRWLITEASKQMIDYWGIKTDDWLLRHQNRWLITEASKQMIDYWGIKTDDWLLRHQKQMIDYWGGPS